ncbi:hypothetical protein EJ02DRAFT_207201 [Clathrospora elynae]|uniref:Uncharacterized protein n=1 Tax=Clathrospora elynae TaxID=706981 RepID=A0A6A5SNK6_9PLEO|nr:hypothetical protein EJ02DRAFT_207201 [Clathrospora elynae]
MEAPEILSAFGTPARAAARILLLPRYVLGGFAPLHAWPQNRYARQRFGAGFRWRIWLLFDCRELEELETLINKGSDAEVKRLRESKIEQFKLVALVGALLASLALQALSLPLISETTFVARSSFTVSFMLSILATFFTCIQQRELDLVRSVPALRAWLSNGVRYTNNNDELVFQSSLASLTLLESPYEFISLAVANFVAGVSAYMWSAWANGLKLHQEEGALTGVAVLVYFAVGTGFAFTMFPLLLGSKDRESRAVGYALDGCEMRLRAGRGWRMESDDGDFRRKGKLASLMVQDQSRAAIHQSGRGDIKPESKLALNAV